MMASRPELPGSNLTASLVKSATLNAGVLRFPRSLRVRYSLPNVPVEKSQKMQENMHLAPTSLI